MKKFAVVEILKHVFIVIVILVFAKDSFAKYDGIRDFLNNSINTNVEIAKRMEKINFKSYEYGYVHAYLANLSHINTLYLETINYIDRIEEVKTEQETNLIFKSFFLFFKAVVEINAFRQMNFQMNLICLILDSNSGKKFLERPVVILNEYTRMFTPVMDIVKGTKKYNLNTYEKFKKLLDNIDMANG